MDNLRTIKRIHLFVLLLFALIDMATPFCGFGQTGIVGSLGGEICVSPIGAASYNIPIEVVPGTNGMEPRLAISYNSTSGRGMLGVGWNLSGLSSISRTHRNQYYDNAVGSVGFDANDRFVLDGTRLIRLSEGSYAATNAVYGAEIEDFTRVTLKGTPNDTSQYFIAVTDQGQIVEYGRTTDSKQRLSGGGTLSWMMDKVTDADGNYMTVQYYMNTSTGEILPIKIRYAYNDYANLSAYASVGFQYINDPNSSMAFVGGSAVSATKLLQKIVVKYRDDIVRQYSFEYDYDRSTRLTDVVLQDGNGNELTRTKIDWGTDQQAASYTTIYGFRNWGRHVLDFNSDGITDLLLTSYESGVCQWYIKKGIGNGSFESTSLSGNLLMVDKVFVVDYNGDGRDGFCYVQHANNSNEYTFKVLDMEGGSLVEKYSQTRNSSQFLIGDFLGQGGVQFLFVGTPSNQQCQVSNSFNNTSFTIPRNSLLSVTDMNGNGKSELQVVNGNHVDIYEYNEQYGLFGKTLDSELLLSTPTEGYHGDFNGDGMRDYVYFACEERAVGHWYLRLSNGNGYKREDEIDLNTDHGHSDTPTFPLLISDINGDGKDDIVQPSFTGNDPLILNVYFSRQYTSSGQSYDTIQIHHSGITDPYFSDYEFADFNQDGKNELFYVGSIFQHPIIVNLPERREHDLVASVRNGFGMATSLEYLYCNSPLAGCPGPEGKRIHYPLVSKTSQPNGTGGVNNTTFTYSHAIFDYGRQQFLGFGFFRSYCNGMNNTQSFEHNEAHHHLGLAQCLTFHYIYDHDPNGYTTDTSYLHQNGYPFYHYETSNLLNYLELPRGRFIPYHSSSSCINRLKNSTVTTSLWLNQEGRVAKSSVTHKKAKSENKDYPWVSSDTTVYDYTTVVLPIGKTAVRPSRVTTTHTRNGCAQAPVDSTVYSYSSGRVSSVSFYDGDGPIGERSFIYNDFGLPHKDTYTPNGMAPMTTSIEYDTKGRFVIQETDALDHTRSATFDKNTGLVTSETGPDNLTTQYQYDDFGRLTLVIRPDRTVRNISYHWILSSPFGNAVWYSQETEVGTPETRTYFDILGRTVHGYCAGRGYSDIEYDSLGRVARKTCIPYDTPGTAAETKTWSVFGYDDYGRVVSENGPYTNLSFSFYQDATASHHDYFVATFDSIRGAQRTMTYDALGRLTRAEDGAGSVIYSYTYETVSGKTRDKMTVNVGNAATTVVCDLRGNRLSIQDPDAGTVTNTYDPLNRLVTSTDANGNQTSYTYDIGGRVVATSHSDGTATESVSYTYVSQGAGIGKPAVVSHNGAPEREYSYDTLGRVSRIRVYDGNQLYDHLYSYDTLGRLRLLVYPDGFSIAHSYDSYGGLSAIRNASNDSLIYSVGMRNAFRQPLKCKFGNGTGTQYAYNQYGMLTGIRNGIVSVSGNIVNGGGTGNNPEINYSIGDEYRDLAYTYNHRGFIDTRTDAKVNQSEAYCYDELDRLTSYSVNGVTAASFTYANSGNITSNSKVGSYAYNGNKPHAVTDITSNLRPAIPSSQCDVTYNLRNRPATLSESGYLITIDYDASGMRRHTVVTNGQTLVKEKTRISDLYELETTPTTSRRLDYVYAEGRIVAVRVYENGTGSLCYVLTDHLGSWEKVLDQSKNTVQQTHFDPWGNRMSYAAWNTSQTQTVFTFDRGFTGHEHYDCMHVINANARLYDPVIGRFFSPDPFVQAPDFTQGFNRYSYCMNNPVMYRDEDGEFLGLPMLGLAFIADLTSNLINGVDHPVQTAWNNATTTVNGMDQCLQFSIPLGENTCLSFGISPFSIGANAGISYTNGTSSFSIGGGYGVLSGPYGYISGSQTIGDATVSASFGGGSNYYGWNMAYTFKGYGIGYGRTYYGSSLGPGEIPNPQMTGTPSIYFPNGSFRLENDYFGDAHDRWRTNAWELSIGNFTLGSTIYTNNPEEMGYGHPNDRPSPLFGFNNPTPEYDYGTWNPGYVYSCPLWIGWRHGNSISRVGYSHPVFQDVTQNFVHKYFPYGRMNFYIDYDYFYRGIYLGGGYYNPFSLY